VIGGITNWTQVSGGSNHSLGVTDTGIAYAWGNGGDGRLGTGDNINRSSPVTVLSDITTNWKQVSAGDFHNVVIAFDIQRADI
jgi:alpha-tubulin suppressor-like RCC1 family protein